MNRLVWTTIVAGLAAGGAIRAAVPDVDPDLLEYLGSVGGENPALHDYLAHTDLSKATAPPTPPPHPSAPPGPGAAEGASQSANPANPADPPTRPPVPSAGAKEPSP